MAFRPDSPTIPGPLSLTQAHYNPAFPGVHFPEHARLSPTVEADVVPGLGNALSGLSRVFGEEIGVLSAHRPAGYNKSIKGAKRSEHINKDAADINMAGWSNAKRATAVRELAKMGITNFITYSQYPNMLHIDMRKQSMPSFMHNKTKHGFFNSAAPGWFKGVANELKGTPVGPSPSFPPAPAGPTEPETGPGVYGAMSAADLAQRYSQAGNRRSYEQGFRPAPAATPVSGVQAIPGRYTPASVAAPVGPASYGVPNVHAPPMSAQPPGSLFAGSGALTPSMASALAAGPQVATPTQGRVATPASPASTFTSPDTRYAGPQNVVANTPMASGMTQARMETPNAGFTGTLTPGLLGEKYAQAAAPAPQRTASVPTPTARPDYAPTAQTPAPAPATVAPAAPAAVSAYPEEGRFSMKKGLTPADQVQMGLTPAPAFTKPATEVPAQKVAEVPAQKVAAVQPVRQQVVKTRTVAPAPAIAPAAPPPEKPAGLIGTLENLVGPFAGPLAKFAATSLLGPAGALATLPFSKTLQNLAGPVPNPPSRNIGTGSAAISGVLSGQAQAGDTAYSASMPGYSVRDLGNGMVEKRNQFGHVSYDKVDKGGGIFSSKPGGLYSANPAGMLSGFGLSGVPSTVGGMLSARNLGSFAGGLIGGMPGAVVGGLLGNMISNKTGTAPAASGGGLFGGFGGFGGGGTSASSGDKRGGGTSSGGRGSMSAGSGGMSKSTRY